LRSETKSAAGEQKMKATQRRNAACHAEYHKFPSVVAWALSARRLQALSFVYSPSSQDIEGSHL
jgi:hypothetical protein